MQNIKESHKTKRFRVTTIQDPEGPKDKTTKKDYNKHKESALDMARVVH